MSDEDADWFESAVEERVKEAADGETVAGSAGGGSGMSDPSAEAEFSGSGADDDAADEPMDFASAFENAPSPGDFGGGGSFEGNTSSSDFKNEDFESDIPRIDIGIEGLDAMIQGGIPQRSLMVAIGDAGTGKTTFGLQFLVNGLEQDERGVFIALEETRERILDTADEKGWDFSTYVDSGQLAVVDLDPVEMANSLTSIRSELPGLVSDFGATRVVLDSVSLLEMMYDDQATRRNEIYDFTTSLKAAGVTTMLTSEASKTNPHRSRFGIIEHLTDAVLVLRYVRPDDFRETRLAVEIQKIRDANHSRELKPYEITDEGISVYRQANIF